VRRRPETTLAALERVYRAQFKAFVRCATAYLGDAAAAADAVQEGVARAIRERRGYRGEGTLEAWLWRVVLNTVRSHYREQLRARTLIDRGGDDDLVASFDGDLTADVVRRAVRQLPERQRLVLFLRFYADMDYATIAALLDMSEGTVGSSLHAAQATLRSLLEEVRA
jgi:RNA polymerase sigma-70 factor (ECF subfamily)